MIDIFEDKSKDWKQYIQGRCQELHSCIFGTVEPTLNEALLYFNFNKILRERYNIGEDYSHHPRNPYWEGSIFRQKRLDNQPKKDNHLSMDQEKLIEYLRKVVADLHDKVFTPVEPAMSDRMTYFAYANYLFVKFQIGEDVAKNPRNPWKGKNIPLSFEEFSSQIKALPSEFKPKEEPKIENNSTQKIGTIELPMVLWRVFDVDVPKRNVFQGTKQACEDYAAQANHDCGYKQFDFVSCNTTFEPRVKKDAGTNLPVVYSPPNTCGTSPLQSCVRNTAWMYSKKTAKERVSEYLQNVNKIGTDEKPPETK
jgi:hypothetical protein